MNRPFKLNVYGQIHTVNADPDSRSSIALRSDAGLDNPHFGCVPFSPERVKTAFSRVGHSLRAHEAAARSVI